MDKHSPSHLDVASLYPDLRPSLERIVRRNISAPEALIEDACQVAWSRLLRDPDRVSSDTVLGWLATTATRETKRNGKRGASHVLQDLRAAVRARGDRGQR